MRSTPRKPGDPVTRVDVVDVLLVEDDDGDALMIEEIFEEHRIPNRLHRVHNGVEAMEFLRRDGGHRDAPRPALVLLDLNMPRMNGHEVLDAVKRDGDLKRIPVVVFTTSNADEDVTRCYHSMANAYVAKPADYDGFGATVHTIDRFFCSVAQRPA
ncbi:response regulator [Actinosynnema sp. NPDC020468]|uniref:response regulator n=1 Tax=Actinosynnema sp. NPDC020468 TaxID=3154488 RepID=UPI0033D17CA1